MNAQEKRGSIFTRNPPWIRRSAIALLTLASVYAAVFFVLRNPGIDGGRDGPPVRADVARLHGDVAALAAVKPSRSAANPAALALAADHVEAEFAKTGCALERHTFEFRGEQYANIACSFGPVGAERVLLGAHYDVHHSAGTAQSGVGTAANRDMPGADDNASGVAGILEIARMVGGEQPELPHMLSLVAFTLEEVVQSRDQPVTSIGSYEYVQKLKRENVTVKLMVSVEMIGYFEEAWFSQSYPAVLAPLLYLIYPTSGNFIGVIGKAWDRDLVARVRKLMQTSDGVPVYSINAPAFVPGIDRSDHKHFWAADYPAVMVTDTADFRNRHYHRNSDGPDTLDYRRMASVVEGLYRVAVEY